MKCTFKVAMDNEQAKAKNHVEVEIDVEKCDDETMLKYAMKAYVVELQSQIRSNWDEFVKGEYPKALVIGEKMFEGRRGAPVTEAKAKEVLLKKLEGMSMDEKIKALKELGLI
jgi:hypothetical protein